MTMTDGQLGILGLNVKPVPETLRYGETLEDYIITQDFNVPIALQPAQVPQLGDARETECAPWDYIVVETGCETSGRPPDYGAYLAGVKYAKPKRPYDTGISAVSGTATAVGASTLSTGLTWTLNQYAGYAITIETATVGSGQWRPILSNTTAGVLTVEKAWDPLPTGTITYKIWAITEIYRKPMTGRTARYYGIREFLCVDSLAEALAVSVFPALTPMATTGPWSYAPLREKTIERRWRVGLAKITCVYDSHAEWGATLTINKGILEGEALVLEDEYDFDGTDLEGQTIDVPFWVGTDRLRWHIIKGGKKRRVIKANFIVHAFLDLANLNAVCALVDTINSGPVTHILSGVAAKTLWFNSLKFRQKDRGQGPFYECWIGLAYNADGWQHATTAQKQKFVVAPVPKMKSDGVTPTGQIQHTWTWKSAGAADVDIEPQGEASYSIIDGFLA